MGDNIVDNLELDNLTMTPTSLLKYVQDAGQAYDRFEIDKDVGVLENKLNYLSLKEEGFVNSFIFSEDLEIKDFSY